MNLGSFLHETGDQHRARHIWLHSTKDFIFCYQQLRDFSNSLTVSVTRGCASLIPNYSRTSSLSELDKNQSFHSLPPHLRSALHRVTSAQTQARLIFSSQYFRGKRYFLFYLKWRLAVVILDLLVGSPEQQHPCTALLKTMEKETCS